ncbi:biliverdin-producing heme oxygenase [Microvirga rosea]|uniref:biliverdin-producing heme oxygenase n=1 Tax=Microvirga rosea TaxID=2715425 RepID=UPI001D0A2E5C|nr:biliverdin-producing heme oxygenase [Microvirga rosea]MCB8819026.1 biliverdin-producing heme oxygenase [Microvirga rosea]
MNLLERLKVETRSAHDRIEKVVDLDRHTATLADYRHLLKRFYGFHSVWEEAAGPLISDREFFRQRRKTALLARDLQQLGMTRDEIAQLPRCHPLMPLAGEAAALGSMYVIEGSTLGGAIIAKTVERRLGLNPETGCAYFRSYGRETSLMWKSFGARLLEISSATADDLIVASAQRTFDVMRVWLGEAP